MAHYSNKKDPTNGFPIHEGFLGTSYTTEVGVIGLLLGQSLRFADGLPFKGENVLQIALTKIDELDLFFYVSETVPYRGAMVQDSHMNWGERIRSSSRTLRLKNVR